MEKSKVFCLHTFIKNKCSAYFVLLKENFLENNPLLTVFCFFPYNVFPHVHDTVTFPPQLEIILSFDHKFASDTNRDYFYSSLQINILLIKKILLRFTTSIFMNLHSFCYVYIKFSIGMKKGGRPLTHSYIKTG